MDSQFEIEVKRMKCYDCATQNSYCKFNFPSINCFHGDGIFAHIKLPLEENEDIPKEILKHIYGWHYFTEGFVKPHHLIHLKKSLNELPAVQQALDELLNS